MTLVVAPAIVSAGRAWVRVLDRGCGRAAVGYLRLVGLVRALVRLAGGSRRLVHPLLGTGPVTGSAGVMHRTSRPTSLLHHHGHRDHCITVEGTTEAAHHVFAGRRGPIILLTFHPRRTAPSPPGPQSSQGLTSCPWMDVMGGGETGQNCLTPVWSPVSVVVDRRGEFWRGRIWRNSIFRTVITFRLREEQAWQPRVEDEVPYFSREETEDWIRILK